MTTLVSHRRTVGRASACLAVALVAVLGAGTAADADATAATPTPTRLATQSAVLRPLTVDQVGTSTATPAQSAAAQQRVLARREVGLPVSTGVRSPAATDEVRAAATAPPVVQRNTRNTRAKAVGSTLAGPAAVKDGSEVFYAGNAYDSYSADAGATWVGRPVHAGPAEAPVPCCDVDEVYDAASDTTFSLRLYTNADGTNGVVDLEVRQGSPKTADCIYRIDPGGAADNVLPDFPHMALTSSYLLVSTNNVGPAGWLGAQMHHLNKGALTFCQDTSEASSTWVGTVGRRVHVPGDAPAGTSCDYWAQYEDSANIRWFQWCDSSSSPVSFLRPTPRARFADPDCRGGVGDHDFIDAPSSWSIAGFTGRTAMATNQVTFLVDVASDGTHPQAYVRGQAINRSSLDVVANPVVASSGMCVGYPAVASNSRNELGLSVAAGGRAGGGGRAAEGYVAVDDAASPGVSFPTLLKVASGTHNRVDGAYGNGLTVRPDDSCPGAWVATSYSLLNGNTLPSHVNARFVQFGSSAQPACA